ncbi:MFS transporter [Zophobihabitans entericus]|uniref:MFS transporter n=1 Tax=Zophobihabitans entericus TaxID=1635327 RepID=A0A6G9IBP5_9GAMM|nr:MFS transporter [Zophobihabitans entericus]QIQ21134.1 MFS transporter [Zophobihabitans entericus]
MSEKQPSNPYSIVGSIYTNYVFLSITIVVIMQFRDAIGLQFNTDVVGIGYIASGLGIGKIIPLLVGGVLSDKFGRKPFIIMGNLLYVVFYLGFLSTTNIHVAFALTVLVGVGNSFLDTGSMPALTENFPQSAGTANVLVKAAVALGTFIIPFIVAFVYMNDIWYGWAFITFAAAFALNAAFVSTRTFPSTKVVISAKAGADSNYFIAKPKMSIEGIALILLGFTSTATFMIVQQWMPTIAIEATGMPALEANKLLSYYSLGSIIACFVIATVVKKLIKPVYCILMFPILSCIVLGVFLIDITPTMCKIASFAIGFTAAGGALQLALVVMSQLFPTKKGFAVGSIYTLSGLSVIVGPLVIPSLAVHNASYAIVFNLGVTALSVLFAAIVNVRYRKVIDMTKI